MRRRELPNFVLARLQNIHVIVKATGEHRIVSCIDIFERGLFLCGTFEELGGKIYFNEDLTFLNNEYCHQ